MYVNFAQSQKSMFLSHFYVKNFLRLNYTFGYEIIIFFAISLINVTLLLHIKNNDTYIEFFLQTVGYASFKER